MNKLFFKKTFIYFGIILFIFLLDRISKLYILSILEDSGFVDININQFINFILVWNSGVGFGLFSFEQSTIYNLITLIIILINLIIIYLIIYAVLMVFFSNTDTPNEQHMPKNPFHNHVEPHE